MYNLSIEVDNQNVSSGNVEVEGTDFYGCGCRANGQCAEVLGYWENDVLTVLLSDEGCGSSEGQILNEGGIYDFEEVGSGSLNGNNSFGLSENGVQAYATYLIHEGDDVTISDRQSINATVRFVPVVEEIVLEDQGTDLEEGEEELPKDGTEQEEVSAVQGSGLEPEEGAEAKVQEGTVRGDIEYEAEAGLAEDRDSRVEDEAVAKEVLGPDVGEEVQEGARSQEATEDALAAVLTSDENIDVSQVVQPEVPAEGILLTEEVEALSELPGQGAEEVLEDQAGLGSQESLEDKTDEEQLELVSQDESLGDGVEGDALAGVLVGSESVDVSQVGQPEVPVEAVLTEKMETELEVSDPGAEEVVEVQAGGDSVDTEDKAEAPAGGVLAEDALLGVPGQGAEGELGIQDADRVLEDAGEKAEAEEQQRELASSDEGLGDEAEEEGVMLWPGRIGHIS